MLYRPPEWNPWYEKRAWWEQIPFGIFLFALATLSWGVVWAVVHFFSRFPLTAGIIFGILAVVFIVHVRTLTKTPRHRP